jgi:hypothetical protein
MDSLSLNYDDPNYDHDKFWALLTFDNFDVIMTYAEALKSSHSAEWQAAIKEGFDAMEHYYTRIPVEKNILPPKQRFFDSTWVFRLKKDEKGNVKYRARLVGRGFKNPNTYDVTKIYAPVADVSDFEVK